MVFFNDRSECYSKRYSCLTKNYCHILACDNYYTKLYITNYTNKINLNIIKETYICMMLQTVTGWYAKG